MHAAAAAGLDIGADRFDSSKMMAAAATAAAASAGTQKRGNDAAVGEYEPPGSKRRR